MFEQIENLFTVLINYACMFIECIGVVVIIITIIKSVIGWLKKKSGIRLSLAYGIALALEIKMGAEVMRTVIVREWSELLILGAVMLLRAAMTFLLHWEIKMEQESDTDEI